VSDENVLTKEIAEEYLKDVGSLELCEFTSITDEAAEVLAKVADRSEEDGDAPLDEENGLLYLYDVTSISDKAVEYLCQMAASYEREQDVWVEGKGEVHEVTSGPTTICLGIETITDSQLASFCRFKGRIQLHNIKELTEFQAGELSKRVHGISCGLTSLPDTEGHNLLLKRLIDAEEDELDLSEITKLSDNQLRMLSERERGPIKLNLLGDTDPATCEKLFSESQEKILSEFKAEAKLGALKKGGLLEKIHGSC
jgi:hypothetical protein